MSYQDTQADGHDGAYVVSSIDDAWIENGMLMGRGRFDLADVRAVEAARKLADGYRRWVSVDLDDTTTTLAVATPDTGGDDDTFDQTQLADGDKAG
jgi:hypothetical protein